MTNSEKPNTLPSVLTYDEGRAVSPALGTTRKERSSTDCGSGRSCRRVTAASSQLLL
jgi:hypothetical protein